MLGPRFGWCGVAPRITTVPAAFGLAGPVGSPLQRVGCCRRARDAWAGRGVRHGGGDCDGRRIETVAVRRQPTGPNPRRTSRLAPDDHRRCACRTSMAPRRDHRSSEQAPAPVQASGARRSRPVTGVRSTSETSGSPAAGTPRRRCGAEHTRGTLCTVVTGGRAPRRKGPAVENPADKLGRPSVGERRLSDARNDGRLTNSIR
jgi:hypothetical protein